MKSRRRVNSTVIWLLILNRLAYHVGTVKVRDVLKLLRNDGWSLITTVGSHRQLKHPSKPGRVTVSGHPSDDIHPKTLKSIPVASTENLLQMRFIASSENLLERGALFWRK